MVAVVVAVVVVVRQAVATAMPELRVEEKETTMSESVLAECAAGPNVGLLLVGAGSAFAFAFLTWVAIIWLTNR